MSLICSWFGCTPDSWRMASFKDFHTDADGRWMLRAYVHCKRCERRHCKAVYLPLEISEIAHANLPAFARAGIKP